MSKTTKSHPASSQEHLDIAEIKEGITILKEGGLRLILLATSINFALKSEQEQNAIIGQYQNFLNSLTFNMQVVMQSRKLDLSGYLKQLEERAKEEKNELIRIQTIDYVQFIKRLITVANIMDKKFYIIIPFDPQNIQRRGLFDKVLHPNVRLNVKISQEEFKSYREEILERSNVIISGLGSLGVKVVPLNTQQIIELFYGVYNPEESNKEKLIDAGRLEEPLIKSETEKPNVEGIKNV